MLIVLDGLPVATPLETMLYKESVAEVAFRNLILELLTAVNIGLACSRLYQECAILLAAHTGVIERIDVNSQEIGRIRSMGYFALYSSAKIS